MILHAVNVHTGGGKVLLDELLAREPFGKFTHLFLDERYDYKPHRPNIVVKRYPPRVLARIKSQFDVRKSVQGMTAPTTVLFFGNNPPVLPIKSHNIVYLQNCFLLEGLPLPQDNKKVLLRSWVERWLLKIFSSFYQEIWIQSDWMLSLTKKSFPHKLVSKKPFLPLMPAPTSQSKIYDFINVSSFSQHKNLNVFFQALEILDLRVHQRIPILLVLDSHKKAEEIHLPRFKNLNVTIRTQLTRNDLFEEYQKSRTAVITSSLESFCLPLYEAQHFKLQILALNAPYIEGDYPMYKYERNHPEDLALALEKIHQSFNPEDRNA